MPAKFGNVKFNLMRAIELFQDMNDEDMDVTAPPSSREFFKEHEVAERLNDFLRQLIEEGLFDDCDLREVESMDEEETSESQMSRTPQSEGFDYDAPSSRESFTGRFKRYVQRILPGGRKSSRAETSSQQHDTESEYNDEDQSEEEEEEEESESRGSRGRSGSSGRRSGSSRGSNRSANGSRRQEQRAGRSRTRRSLEVSQSGSHSGSSRGRSSELESRSEVVLGHTHTHKHNHPNSHHHHEHLGAHSHTHHSHDDEMSNAESVRSELLPEDEEGYESHGLSGAYRADSDDDLNSEPVDSPRMPNRRSRSASSTRRRSQPRSRGTSRSRS